MRWLAVVVVLAAFDAGAGAQQPEYTAGDGKYKVRFPGTGQPKLRTEVTKSAVGDLTVNIATFANSDGSVWMVSYTDFPAAATKPENHKSLLDGIRDGAKGRDGKLSGEEKTLEHGADKLPGREFVVEKGKQRVRMRVVVSGNRVYQVALIGTEAFVTGKDGTAFLDSFSITK